MYNPSYNDGPFAGLFSVAEAADLWCIDESTIRKAISDGRLKPGIDCRKFGKQWVITYEAMDLRYGLLPKEKRDKLRDKFGMLPTSRYREVDLNQQMNLDKARTMPQTEVQEKAQG